MAWALAGCGSQAPIHKERGTFGLSTSLPLVWSESGDIRGQLAQPKAAHWALAAMARRGQVVPLDTLSGPRGLARLEGASLVMAQPHPLTPEENVALDAWVRAGGRLLLFADPMLTAHSDYALGDPRRPEAIAMLSPILRHWGLELQFDDTQPAGERVVQVFGTALPVDLPGRFEVRGAACGREAEGLVVECAVGRGRVIAVADAAVFDGEDAGRTAALEALLDRLVR